MLPTTPSPHPRSRGPRVAWPARACAAGAVLLGLAAGCARPGAPDPAERSVLRISQRNEPATLDPQLATLTDEFFVIRALAEGLLVPNPGEGPPLPGVAARWTASADGLRWTFHLRPEARWSNGDPVTAEDFLFTIRRALDPALAAPTAPFFAPLAAATAPDPHTLLLTLKQPWPDLPHLVASGPWLPVHPATLTAHGGATARDGAWTRPGNHVGNGPFVLTAWAPGQHLAAAPNPRYWQAARVHLGGLRFQIYDSGDTEERAFRAGQVDITLAVPFTKLGGYAPPVLRRQPLHETRYLAFNVRRPPLDDARVRRALALAVDREALVAAVTKGGQQPARHFLPPGLGGHRSDLDLTRPAASAAAALAEARALLAAAGYPDGAGFPTLEFSSWVNTPVLEAIQQMWRRELGVTTAIVQREGKVHVAGLIAGDFAIGFMPAIPDFDSPLALLGLFTTGAPENYPHWSDARYDAHVAAATRATEPARRAAELRAAEERLLRELPVAPLYFNTQNFLVAPRVRGWRASALWVRTYLDVALDP